MPGYARLVCNGVVKGKPYPYCSRVALRAQAARLEERGLTMFTGIEPEFMLLSRRADGSLGPADATDDLDKPCYDYKGLYRAREPLDEMVAALRAVGIDVYQIDHEDGNGQFEINFTYADALKSADNFTFVKMAASEIAHKHGMIATFMPKPFPNRAGSGAHFHVSLGSAAQKNAFHDPNDESGMGLSPMAYHFWVFAESCG
jgi:glutamine synthetase